MGAIVGLGALAACDTAEAQEEIPVSLPDYADDREFDLLAYVNPTNGDYTFNNISYNIGTDFRTVERFEEYKDAGMNIAFARYDSSLPANVTAETWGQSDTKLFCDKAYAAGLDKILITDFYLTDFITTNETRLIGDVFETEKDLDAAIATRLAIYKDMPGFYGVILTDEPTWDKFDNYALVHKSLKRVMPEIYIYNNLHFSFGSINLYTDVEVWKEKHGKSPTQGEAYWDYLCQFLEKTGAENLSVDIYPFKDEAVERISNYYVNLQQLRNACTKYGAEMTFTSQAICYTAGTKLANRIVNKSDLWLQMNAVLGFGAKGMQYYTYMPHPMTSTEQSNFGNFLDKNGNKTSVYYDAKSVNESVKRFDHILLHYEYQGARFYLNDMMQNVSESSYVGGGAAGSFENADYTALTSLTMSNDAIFTTELKDETNNLYMYMIMNPIDSLFSGDGIMSYTENTFTAEFSGYDYVAEFDCGELTYVKLDNGKYTKTLSSGYGVYLVPLKAA
ncbi:MAG: hypothetical protein ACI4SH_06645 [Candidatus Scatosoma sp.]